MADPPAGFGVTQAAEKNLQKTKGKGGNITEFVTSVCYSSLANTEERQEEITEMANRLKRRDAQPGS